MATLAELRNKVRSRMGVAADDLVLPNVGLDLDINEALQEIATDKDWPWLYAETSASIATGAGTLALPADYNRTIYFRVGEVTLEPLGPRDASTYTDSTPAPPVFYTFAGANFKLYPAADATVAYTLAYVRTEPELVADGDSPLLPTQHQDWLVNLAAVKTATRTNNSERLAKVSDAAAVWRERVLDNVRRAEGMPRIRRTKESIWQDV